MLQKCSWKASGSFKKSYRFKNLPEDEKQRLVQYRKKYYKIWKKRTASQTKTDWCFLASNNFRDFARYIYKTIS